MKAKTIAFACGMGLIGAGAVGNPAVAGHWYIAGQAGAVFLNSANFTANSPGGLSSPGATLHFDTGWGVGGSGGYGFDNGFRVEGEVTYRQNGLNHATSPGGFSSPVSGHESSWAFMANGYYDINTGSPWTPYVGGGIGLALEQLSLNNVPVTFSSSTDFAYQGIAGIGYQITDAVNIAVEYRYFGTTGPSYGISGGPVPPGTTYDGSYGSNNIMLKLRWNLN